MTVRRLTLFAFPAQVILVCSVLHMLLIIKQVPERILVLEHDRCNDPLQFALFAHSSRCSPSSIWL